MKEKEQKSNYLKIAEIVPVKVWITEKNGSCTYLNKKWYDYTGQEPGAGEGDGWHNAIHPDDRERVAASFTEANDKQVPVHLEYRLRNNKGHYRWHLDVGEPILEDGKFEGFIGSVIDIHEKKEAEQELRRSEAWYKSYAEAMPQMAFIADPSGEIVYFNKRWYEYIKGMKGTEGWGWTEQPVHHPDDLQRTIDKWNHCLKTGESYEIEYRLRRYDGEYRWYLGRANPVYSNGEITFWFGTNTDIHEQKISEEKLQKANKVLKRKNKKLHRLRKLNENLLYIIAHDLKAPVGNMKLALEFINSETERDKKEQMMEIMEQMVKQQERTLDGLSEIIQMQTPEELNFKEIDIEDLIEDIINEFQSELNERNATFIYDLKEMPKIVFVHSFLYSILKNLISNSIKYAQDSKPLKIEISGMKKKGFFLLKVKDNGIGIDLKKHGRNMFHAFERFTGQGEGTGIGLYIVKNLIEDNDGYVEVQSTPGEGTSFLCYLKEYG